MLHYIMPTENHALRLFFTLGHELLPSSSPQLPLSLSLSQLLEEAGLTAHALEEVGLLSFVFDDGKHWLVHGRWCVGRYLKSSAPRPAGSSKCYPLFCRHYVPRKTCCLTQTMRKPLSRP